MKAVFKRLNRIEERLVPRVNLASQRDAEIARERRRRRLEASGETDEPLDWASLNLPPGTRLSERETARLARQLRLKRQGERDERVRQAAVGQI